MLDPGFGYEYNYDEGAENNLTVRFISANGEGASLEIDLEENGTLAQNVGRYLYVRVDDNYTLVGGSGYDLNDIVVAPAALLYELEEPSMLRARLHDPMNEVSQLRFYGNGVESYGHKKYSILMVKWLFRQYEKFLSYTTNNYVECCIEMIERYLETIFTLHLRKI